MATVVRVKRRFEEDPVDSLVLLCKKVKTGTNVGPASASLSETPEAVKSVFKFAGTYAGTVSVQCSIHASLMISLGLRSPH